MIIIVAVDNNNGLLFNSRRVSRDRTLREKIAAVSSGSVLWMNAFTARQFEEGLPSNARVDERFLDKAAPGDFCFVEDKLLMPYLNRIETMVVFRWNRDYPSDFKLDLEPVWNGFYLASFEDFEGTSHDKITMEVWESNSTDPLLRKRG